MANKKSNPLAGYYRAPKMYTEIPTGGKYYDDKIIEWPDTNELPVYPMTAKDEMIMKNPDALLNYGDGELKERVKELTGGTGADVIYDPVGGDLFDQSCRCINWNGRLLVVGFASGRIPEYKANLALLKGSSMVGVFLGRFRKEEPAEYEKNFAELLDMYDAGKLKPIVTESFTMTNFVDAFNVFTERKVMGKVTLEINKE